MVKLRSSKCERVSRIAHKLGLPINTVNEVLKAESADIRESLCARREDVCIDGVCSLHLSKSDTDFYYARCSMSSALREQLFESSFSGSNKNDVQDT